MHDRTGSNSFQLSNDEGSKIDQLANDLVSGKTFWAFNYLSTKSFFPMLMTNPTSINWNNPGRIGWLRILFAAIASVILMIPKLSMAAVIKFPKIFIAALAGASIAVTCGAALPAIAAAVTFLGSKAAFIGAVAGLFGILAAVYSCFSRSGSSNNNAAPAPAAEAAPAALTTPVASAAAALTNADAATPPTPTTPSVGESRS